MQRHRLLGDRGPQPLELGDHRRPLGVGPRLARPARHRGRQRVQCALLGRAAGGHQWGAVDSVVIGGLALGRLPAQHRDPHLVLLGRREQPALLPARHRGIGHLQQPPARSDTPTRGWVFLPGSPSRTQTQNATSAATRYWLLSATAAADPAAAALISWAVLSATFPGAQMPSMLVRPVRSVATQPSASSSQPRAVSSSSDGTKRGPTNNAVRLIIGPSATSTPRTPVSSDTIRVTSPSTIRTPRATNRSRSWGSRSIRWGKNTTSSDHCRISCAWRRLNGRSSPPITPSALSRTS